MMHKSLQNGAENRWTNLTNCSNSFQIRCEWTDDILKLNNEQSDLLLGAESETWILAPRRHWSTRQKERWIHRPSLINVTIVLIYRNCTPIKFETF